MICMLCFMSFAPIFFSLLPRCREEIKVFVKQDKGCIFFLSEEDNDTDLRDNTNRHTGAHVDDIYPKSFLRIWALILLLFEYICFRSYLSRYSVVASFYYFLLFIT